MRKVCVGKIALLHPTINILSLMFFFLVDKILHNTCWFFLFFFGFLIFFFLIPFTIYKKIKVSIQFFFNNKCVTFCLYI